MSTKESESRFLVSRNGMIEPKRQRDKNKAKMFQFMKTKKGGRRK